jgi:hypothetical protein
VEAYERWLGERAAARLHRQMAPRRDRLLRRREIPRRMGPRVLVRRAQPPRLAARRASHLQPRGAHVRGDGSGRLHRRAQYAHGCVERACDFLRRYAKESSSLVVSVDEPHHAFLAPGSWYERFEEFEVDRGPSVEEELSNKPISHRRMAQHKGGMHSRDGRKVRHPAYFGCKPSSTTRSAASSNRSTSTVPARR